MSITIKIRLVQKIALLGTKKCSAKSPEHPGRRKKSEKRKKPFFQGCRNNKPKCQLLRSVRLKLFLWNDNDNKNNKKNNNNIDGHNNNNNSNNNNNNNDNKN